MSSSSAVPSSSSSSLHVVFASHDLVAASLTSEGLGTNRPVVRKRAIIESLNRAADDITKSSSSSSSCNITFAPISSPTVDLSAALAVHDAVLVDLFNTGFDRWTALGPNRDLYYSTGGRVDPDNWHQLVPSQVAPRESNASLQRPGKSLHGAVSFYAQDCMTPITSHTSVILRSDMAVTIECVRSIQSNDHRQVYACTTEPGHHSSRQSYGGYCYVNHAALAATMLKSSHTRVGLLDVDYHAGNGSMSIFYSDPNVIFASIHADPEIEYPYCSGWSDQTGADGAVGTTINVPLPKGTTWSQYAPHLQSIIDRFVAFGVGALVVSLGVDTLAADPECAPLAGFSLVQDDYVDMGNMIRGMNVPTIWIQEGGYKLDEAGEVVRKVLVGNIPSDA